MDTDLFLFFSVFLLLILSMSVLFETTECPAGLYSTELGAVSSSVCIGCPHGQYSSTTGLTSLDECNNCAAGKKNPYVGSNSSAACIDCGNDTKAAAEASFKCDDCPLGWSSDKGSAKCVACGAGTFGQGCQQCPVGFARKRKDSATQCQKCQPGLTTV